MHLWEIEYLDVSSRSHPSYLNRWVLVLFFFYFDFASRSVWRTNGRDYVSLPPEHDIAFCGQLKIGITQYMWSADSVVVETMLHIFINSFHLSVSGLMTRRRETNPAEYIVLKRAYNLSSECLLTFQKAAKLAKQFPDVAETYAEEAFTYIISKVWWFYSSIDWT